MSNRCYFASKVNKSDSLMPVNIGEVLDIYARFESNADDPSNGFEVLGMYGDELLARCVRSSSRAAYNYVNVGDIVALRGFRLADERDFGRDLR